MERRLQTDDIGQSKAETRGQSMQGPSLVGPYTNYGENERVGLTRVEQHLTLMVAFNAYV